MRGRLARAVVRFYPAEFRVARGDELVGTLLDAGDASAGAFLVELVSVIAGGLIARSRSASSRPPGQIASDAVRWGAVITVASSMTSIVVEYVHWGAGLNWMTATSWQQCLAPTLVLALFILGQDRGAGVIGLSWCVVVLIRQPEFPASAWIAWLALPILGFAVMTARPRHPVEPGRSLVLVPILAWACFRWTELGLQSGIGYLTPAIAAAAFATLTPALTLGTALAWSLLAAYYLTIPVAHFTTLSIALLSCTPIAVALVGLSRRAIRARSSKPC